MLDHLGSVSVVTDESGAVVSGGRQSYDAWGRERNADGTADTGCALPAQSQTTRGYTSQEEIPSVCLVNMNARLYDPQIGRFMAADSVVQNPYDAQDLNRYTYVVNNPLSETDPTGNCHGMLECVGDAYLDLVVPNWVLRPTIRQYPVVGSALTIAAAIECYAICAALSAAEVAGITTGDAGKTLEAFAITYVEGIADAAVTNLNYDTGSPILDTLERAGYHGFVGGLTSSAQGGRFGSGFLAAAFGSLAGAMPNPGGVGGAIEAATLGGVGSVLGGGKFANGAVTGAFAYLAAGGGSGGGGNGSAGGQSVDDDPNISPHAFDNSESLDYRVISQSSGSNGGYSSYIDWMLSVGAPSGGWIVQEITVTGMGSLAGSLHYWEAWPVDFGATAPHAGPMNYDDRFSIPSQPDGSSGSYEIHASARYYDNISLPKDFVAGSVPQAGGLRATTVDPHLPSASATPVVSRSVSGKWP